MAHIYKITSPTGKVYVGSSTNVEYRFRVYRLKKCKRQVKLYASLLKYGPENHKFEIITECAESEMFKVESVYGHMYDVLGHNGLNLGLPKNGDFYQSKSEATRDKLCKNRIKLNTPEYLQWMRDINIGRKHTDATRQKMSKKKKGRIPPCGSGNCQRPVLNIETGIFYPSILSASKTTRFSRGYLTNMLSGIKRNRTSFIYA